MLLGCLETPPAFLEAVPSAWIVTRGVVDALRASTATSSVPPPLLHVTPVKPMGEWGAKWEVKENYRPLPTPTAYHLGSLGLNGP